MSRFISFIVAFALAGTVAFAHEGNEHVRGVVTQISAQSVTVQTAPKVTKTLTLSDKTTYKQAGKGGTPGGSQGRRPRRDRRAGEDDAGAPDPDRHSADDRSDPTAHK